MAKEKLFTPEDFDKPKPKNNKLLKTILIILGVLILIGLCIWGYCYLKQDKNNSTNPDDTGEQVEQVTPIIGETLEQTDTISEVKVETEDVDNNSEEQVSETEEQSAQSTTPALTPNTTISVSIPPVSNDVEAEALKVVRGDYGNVPERKQLLGDQYQVIQDRVNQMKRQGLF